MIRQRPSLGAALLKDHYSTAEYADIAEGHHLWYNGKGGYPMGFSAEKSGMKILIDIVTIADCMDAATDSVGRSYNSGKTFNEFREEVKKDAGIRYSPCVAEILYDEKLEEEITFILKECRKQAYLNTYNLLKNT